LSDERASDGISSIASERYCRNEFRQLSPDLLDPMTPDQLYVVRIERRALKY
jgi:hypothetical protein